jgi:hypothetical protein
LTELRKNTGATCMVTDGVLVAARGPVRVEINLAEHGITADLSASSEDEDSENWLAEDEFAEDDLGETSWGEETDNDRG